MKKYLFIFVMIISSTLNAQFKDPVFPTETPRDGITDNSAGSLLGFLSSENFSMHHSVGVSYSSIGGYGTSIANYTNSMMYRFSDKMNVQLDASFVTSPYSAYGKDFQNSIQGIYISRAAFNFKPWDDVSFSIQYRNVPNYYYNPFSRYNGNSFYDGFFGSSHDSFMY